MIVIFWVSLVFLLNCIASPNETPREPNPMKVWSNEVKNTLNKLVEDPTNEELRDELMKNLKEMPSHNEEIIRKMVKRLDSPQSNYCYYMDEHEFNEIDRKKFLKNFKNAIGKECGTFLIEYELFVIEKKEWEKENLKILTEQINQILNIVKDNEAYCEIAPIENAKTELLTNLENEQEIKNGVKKFVELIKFNIFENELKAKIDDFIKTPYIFAGNFITFLGYIQDNWPKMDNVRWDTLGKTLDKINKKIKKILEQIKKTIQNLETEIEKLKKEVENLPKNDDDNDEIVELEKIDDYNGQKLKEIVQKTLEAYAKVMEDMERVGCFSCSVNVVLKRTIKKAERLEPEESIKKYLFGDDDDFKKAIIWVKSMIKEVFEFIKANIEKKSNSEKEKKKEWNKDNTSDERADEDNTSDERADGDKTSDDRADEDKTLDERADKESDEIADEDKYQTNEQTKTKHPTKEQTIEQK